MIVSEGGQQKEYHKYYHLNLHVDRVQKNYIKATNYTNLFPCFSKS